MMHVIRSLTHSTSPAVYNLTAMLPSLKYLQGSFDRLRELCTPCKYMLASGIDDFSIS